MKNNRDTDKRNRQYDKSLGTKCLARGSHRDAVVLVDWLLGQGGKTNLTRGQIVEVLGWARRMPGGIRQNDMPRIGLAINHVRDGRVNGEPCTGWGLHYRTSARGNVLMLVDPKGSLAHQKEVAAREIAGDIQQEVAFRTINGRRIATAHQVADMCLGQEPPDLDGYQAMTRYAMDLERNGSPTNDTLATVTVWFGKEPV